MLGERNPLLELFDTQIHDIIYLMSKGVKKQEIMQQWGLTEYQWRKLKEMKGARL